MRPLPQLEHHERPQPVAVVGAFGRVLVEQACDGVVVEPTALACLPVEEQLACQRLKLAATDCSFCS